MKTCSYFAVTYEYTRMYIYICKNKYVNECFYCES